ncbi:MAG TPA: chemotaxis protein CheW [Polyangiaceae bacterium]|jgi:purine-binding chemotaxis protein CheW|nr:chemotaxis protein CheW [Polyangiaceae bacterium]
MTTQYCTFALGSLLLAVEARSVQEVLRSQQVTPVPLAPDFVRGLMNLRGQIVLVVDLRVHLGSLEPTSSSKSLNVLLQTSAGLVSMLADQIGDVIDVEDDCQEPIPDTLQGRARDVLAGALRLPDRLLLLLNPERIAVA